MTQREKITLIGKIESRAKMNDWEKSFAVSIVGKFVKFGNLTPAQEATVDKIVAKLNGEKPEQKKVDLGGFGAVIERFQIAKQHLKFPKIRLQVQGEQVVLKLAGVRSQYAGSVSMYPYGTINPEGEFTPSFVAKKMPAQFKIDLVKILKELASDPVKVIQEQAKLQGACMFCGHSIGHGEERRSANVGFGPDCAEHWGLLAEWKAAVERSNPTIERDGLDDILNDAAQERLRLDAEFEEEKRRDHESDYAGMIQEAQGFETYHGSY